MQGQLNIFDMTLPEFKIDRPIRLIELFAGIGSQAMALRGWRESIGANREYGYAAAKHLNIRFEEG